MDASDASTLAGGWRSYASAIWTRHELSQHALEPSAYDVPTVRGDDGLAAGGRQSLPRRTVLQEPHDRVREARWIVRDEDMLAVTKRKSFSPI
jgi:hypothetical protein